LYYVSPLAIMALSLPAIRGDETEKKN